MKLHLQVLCRYENRWNMDLKLKPFFLGGIMNESGNQQELNLTQFIHYFRIAEYQSQKNSFDTSLLDRIGKHYHQH